MSALLRGLRGTPPPAPVVTVDQALAALAAAGWTVQQDTAQGHLTYHDDVLTVAVSNDPGAKRFARTVAYTGWVEA